MSDTDTRSVWDVAAANITPATHDNMAQRAGALHALLLLGIDPDMPFSTLHAALGDADSDRAATAATKNE